MGRSGVDRRAERRSRETTVGSRSVQVWHQQGKAPGLLPLPALVGVLVLRQPGTASSLCTLRWVWAKPKVGALGKTHAVC